LHPLVRRGPLVDHLRLDLQILVGAEERVVDEIAVVACDVRRRPDRIEHLEIGVGDEPHRPSALLRVDRGEAHRRGRRDGGSTGDEVATTGAPEGMWEWFSASRARTLATPPRTRPPADPPDDWILLTEASEEEAAPEA